DPRAVAEGLAPLPRQALARGGRELSPPERRLLHPEPLGELPLLLPRGDGRRAGDRGERRGRPPGADPGRRERIGREERRCAGLRPSDRAAARGSGAARAARPRGAPHGRGALHRHGHRAALARLLAAGAEARSLTWDRSRSKAIPPPTSPPRPPPRTPPPGPAPRGARRPPARRRSATPRSAGCTPAPTRPSPRAATAAPRSARRRTPRSRPPSRATPRARCGIASSITWCAATSAAA